MPHLSHLCKYSLEYSFDMRSWLLHLTRYLVSKYRLGICEGLQTWVRYLCDHWCIQLAVDSTQNDQTWTMFHQGMLDSLPVSYLAGMIQVSMPKAQHPLHDIDDQLDSQYRCCHL